MMRDFGPPRVKVVPHYHRTASNASQESYERIFGKDRKPAPTEKPKKAPSKYAENFDAIFKKEP